MNLNMPWSRREDVIQYFSLIPVLHCHDKLGLNLGNFYPVPGSCREEKGLPLSWRIADIDFVECWCLWLVTFHWWITKKEWLLCTLERAQITGFQLLFPWQIFSLYTFFFSLSLSLSLIFLCRIGRWKPHYKLSKLFKLAGAFQMKRPQSLCRKNKP